MTIQDLTNLDDADIIDLGEVSELTEGSAGQDLEFGSRSFDD